MKLIQYIKLSLIIILCGIIYYPAFIWMWGRWNTAGSYYSHGPAIILAVLFFIWNSKNELKTIIFKPSNKGIIFIIAGIFLHFSGMVTGFIFLSAFSMVVLFSGIVLYCLGSKAFKTLLFPITYLLFMIPLPLVLTSNIVLRMKLFAAQAAVIMLNKIGIQALRDGSIIRTLHSFLEIEAPCSGLRSLIALLAFGAAFAYLTKNSILKKWLVFLSALPIALSANILRIVLLGWVSEIYGMQAAHGWIHDFSGFLLFAFAGMCLLGLNSLFIKYEDTYAG
ncbi:MAG: hypothetical protein DRP78_02540 [Candidatus Omnitrophota bacterium]|nr:MAG: hypothetical protein DRP78_02540 [Candidatus Omnitrophota bacterium]